MSEFNFKSAICTSREQSERLLALGLKKETADMHWAYHSVTATRYVVAHPCDGVGECIPAWSLHRLIEMYDGWVDVGGIGISTARGVFNGKDNTYDNLIDAIEYEIKWYDFNKEYLV